MKLLTWAPSNLTGVLRRNLGTHRDTREAHAQRKGRVRMQSDGGHLHAKERDLRRNQDFLHLAVELQNSEKISFYCLNHCLAAFVMAAPAELVLFKFIFSRQR